MQLEERSTLVEQLDYFLVHEILATHQKNKMLLLCLLSLYVTYFIILNHIIRQYYGIVDIFT